MTNDLQTLKQAYEKWCELNKQEEYNIKTPNNLYRKQGFSVGSKSAWPLIEGLLIALTNVNMVKFPDKGLSGEDFAAYCFSKIKENKDQALQDFKTKIGVSNE